MKTYIKYKHGNDWIDYATLVTRMKTREDLLKFLDKVKPNEVKEVTV